MLTLWQRDPLLTSIDRVFDDVMRSAFGTYGTATNSQAYQPAIDVRADDDKIVFECDVPGMKRDDLEVTLQDRVLTIKGSRKFESSNEKEHVVLGRAYGSFSCSYTLPDGVDAEHLSADLSDGVLVVTIPRLAHAKPRRIAIGSGATTKQLAG